MHTHICIVHPENRPQTSIRRLDCPPAMEEVSIQTPNSARETSWLDCCGLKPRKNPKMTKLTLKTFTCHMERFRLTSTMRIWVVWKTTARNKLECVPKNNYTTKQIKNDWRSRSFKWRATKKNERRPSAASLRYAYERCGRKSNLCSFQNFRVFTTVLESEQSSNRQIA